MASSAEKKGAAFFDDDNDADVILLSSDTDDESSAATPVIKKASGAAVPPATANGDRDVKKGTLLGMGFQVRPRSSSNSSSSSSSSKGRPKTNGHKSAGRSSTTTSAKPKLESDGNGALNDSVITLDDDSDFEIEYSRNDTDTNPAAGRGGGTQNIGDSDDDIEIIEDGSYPIRYNKKRFSQEPGGTAEVNLSLPGINLGIISAGSRKSNKSEAVSAAPAVHDESSEDMVVVEQVVEDDDDPAIPVLEGEEVDLVDTEEEGEEEVPVANVNYNERSRRALERFINEFCARKHRGVKKEKLEKVKKKVWNAYETIAQYRMTIHKALTDIIEDSTHTIRTAPDELWKTLKTLLDLMEPSMIVTLDGKSDTERKQDREKQKSAFKHKYEKELRKIQKKILEYEEREVDWDDEDDHNSAYILADKYKAKLIKNYYTLCDFSYCNHFTGRPIQTRINLRKHNASSNCEPIDTEVEKFINKRGFMFAPDYTDILDIITKTNQTSALGLNQDETLKLAQRMFENVIKIIKKRREKDFKMSMLSLLPKAQSSSGRSRPPPPESEPSTSSPPPSAVTDEDDNEDMDERLQDPAEADAELQAKLAENEKLKKSEAEVIEKFFKLAQEKGHQASAVDEESANNSPPPSDNEEEDDDEDDDEDEVNKSHHDRELTEDEDEVPETVTSGWKGGDLEEEDDNSNEGKTTAESESDTNVDGDAAEDNVVASSAVPDSNTAPVAVPSSTSATNASSDSTPKTVAAEESKAEETVDKDDDIQPPPAKRMRSDENCNEDISSVRVDESVPTPTAANGEDEVMVSEESTPIA